MNDETHSPALVLAGRHVEGVMDRVRRYCGLRWTGGAPETWAYRYYDAVDTDPDVLGEVDVLTTSALHPGLSRTDLAYFYEHGSELGAWLADVPINVALHDADDALLEYLGQLYSWEEAPSLTLLSKVLHRKRPALIPLVDRHIVDWYRPVTGERSPQRAWPLLLRALRDDLGGRNARVLTTMNDELEEELGRCLSHLRLVDIGIWMGGQG